MNDVLITTCAFLVSGDFLTPTLYVGRVLLYACVSVSACSYASLAILCQGTKLRTVQGTAKSILLITRNIPPQRRPRKALRGEYSCEHESAQWYSQLFILTQEGGAVAQKQIRAATMCRSVTRSFASIAALALTAVFSALAHAGRVIARTAIQRTSTAMATLKSPTRCPLAVLGSSGTSRRSSKGGGDRLPVLGV